jgi:flagellar basal-body rod protein FlgG
MDTLAIGLSGLTASRLRGLTSANNLANLNTPGYKEQRANSGSLSNGAGATINSISKTSTNGALIPTGNPLDLAIIGDGHFQVTDVEGNNAFTRDGSFSLNADGQMVNSQGLTLDPGITIPQDAQNVTIASDGAVSAQVNGETVELGNIQIASFSNPQGLSNGGGNLQSQTGSSGIPQMGLPGTEGRGYIQSGFIEGSNVDIARQAIALREEENAFKANAAVIRTADDMTREAIDLIA